VTPDFRDTGFPRSHRRPALSPWPPPAETPPTSTLPTAGSEAGGGGGATSPAAATTTSTALSTSSGTVSTNGAGVQAQGEPASQESNLTPAVEGAKAFFGSIWGNTGGALFSKFVSNGEKVGAAYGAVMYSNTGIDLASAPKQREQLANQLADPNAQTAATETKVGQYQAANAQITGNFVDARAEDINTVGDGIVAGVELAADTYLIHRRRHRHQTRGRGGPRGGSGDRGRGCGGSGTRGDCCSKQHGSGIPSRRHAQRADRHRRRWYCRCRRRRPDVVPQLRRQGQGRSIPGKAPATRNARCHRQVV